MVDLSVKIGNLSLQNPIMPASGTFSAEFSKVIDLNRLGALVAKTVSRDYRAGNPPPRVSELDGGMINSIGLPTKGLNYFQEVQLAEYKKFKPPLVCSINGPLKPPMSMAKRPWPSVAVLAICAPGMPLFTA